MIKHTNLNKISAFINIIIISMLVFAIDGYSAELLDKGSSVVFSLEETIKTAYKNNRDIQIAEYEVRASKAGILDATSEFLPKVELDANYRLNAASLGTLASGLGTNSKKDIGVYAGYKNDNFLGLNLEESVYDGGKSIANFEQSKINFTIQKETLRAKKLDIEFEAKRLFYGLLLAYETERIAKDLVDQAEDHYQDVKKKFEHGTSSRFDLLQSKVHVSLVIPELVKATNSVDLIKSELKKLLSLNMRDDIKLKGELSYSLINIDEESFLAEACKNKPEMILKFLGIDMNKWSIDMAKSGMRPKLSLDADYSYRTGNLNNMINPRHNNWSFGVAVVLPIFDGFSSKAKVDEAKAKYAEAVLSKEDMTDQIAVEIRRGCLDLVQAESIINSQKDSIIEAQEALKIANVSYEYGVGTNLDVIDAEVSLSQVQTNLYQAIYDYLMAQAYLDRTMGKEYIKDLKLTSTK